MAFWEFLIQKEGDRSWLPLGSSKVEILEGRYRIVAHSDRSNAPVEIRVIHDATAEIPPMRRTQKRVSRTNKNGLVAILPFTRLLPGVWELRCTSDLMADMLGEGWQHSVQLQVLPLEVEDDWDPDWQDAHQLDSHQSDSSLEQVTNAEAAEVAAIPSPDYANVAADRLDVPLDVPDVPVPDVPVDPPVDSEIDPAESHPANLNSAELDETASVTAPADGIASNLLPLAERSIASPTTDVTPVRLRLGQDTFIIQRGQSLTLMGQVEASDGQPTEHPVLLTALQVRLYDPRTSKILAEQQQPLTDRPLPFPFTCQITLPDDFQTYLVLGEVILHSGTAAAATAVSHPFSVTTDLHELLDAIANDFSETELLPPPGLSADAESLNSLNPAIASPSFSSATTDVVSYEVQFQLSPQQPLPPQLYPAEVNADRDSVRKPLELPSFQAATTLADSAEPLPDPPIADATVTDRPMAAQDLKPPDAPTSATDGVNPASDSAIAAAGDGRSHPEQAATSDAPIGAMADTAIGDTVAPDRQPESPASSTPAIVPQAFDNDAPIPDWEQLERTEQPPIAQPIPDSPEDVAFRSLNLQARFWHRLQALATDRELVEWLRTIDPVFEAKQARFETQSLHQTADRDAELTAQEIVVEDEFADRATVADSVMSMNSAATMPVLPIQDPVPVPQLDIPPGELTSGEQVSIRVTLPNGLPHLLVKLWFVDRQNRTVLDGPHWLLDFSPDGFEHLTAETKVLVPYGCIEVQVEAIAIEMATQRESDKAIVVRAVVPPELSAPLDEIDVWDG